MEGRLVFEEIQMQALDERRATLTATGLDEIPKGKSPED